MCSFVLLFSSTELLICLRGIRFTLAPESIWQTTVSPLMTNSALMTFSSCLFPTESNSSSSDSESFLARWRFFFGHFFMHFTAKWFLFLHALQTFPHAGHSCFCKTCVCQRDLHIAFDLYGFRSWVETLQASAMVSSTSLRYLSCWEVALAARHISTQVLRLRRPLVALVFLWNCPLFPRRCGLLDRESFRQSQKVHVEARVRRVWM